MRKSWCMLILGAILASSAITSCDRSITNSSASKTDSANLFQDNSVQILKQPSHVGQPAGHGNTVDSLYVYIGEPVYFLIDTTSILIQWNPDNQNNNQSDYPYLGAPLDTHVVQNFVWYSLTGNYSYKTILRILRQTDGINRVNEVLYQRFEEMGEPVNVYTFIGDEIICRFKETVNRRFINNLLSRYKLTIVDSSSWHKNEFTFRVLPACPLTTAKMSNLLGQLPMTYWAEPNFGGGGGADLLKP